MASSRNRYANEQCSLRQTDRDLAGIVKRSERVKASLSR
jgi:hypothetical protein